MSLKKTFGFALLMLILVLVAACKRGPFKAVGSCDLRENDTSGSAICMDVDDSKADKARSVCLAQGNKWSETPCSGAGQLGACQRDSSMRFWYYGSSKHTSADDVKKECKDDKTFVSPGAG